MKRILLFLLIISCFTCVSCEGNDKITYYHNLGFTVIDEQCLYNDKYYVKSFKTKDENMIEYEFYLKENNALSDEIIIPKVFPTFAIYDDVLYLKYEKEDKIYYSYKLIGSGYDINENLAFMEVKDFNDLITVNNQLFYSNSDISLQRIGYDLPQIPAKGFSCEYVVVPGTISEIFSISVDSNEKSLTLNSVNSNKHIKYNFPSDVVDAKYNYKTNLAFMNWPKWDEKDSYYYKNEYVIYLKDDYLYFSYSKYLGEFENANHYCTMPALCLFSNCKTEILRYNPKKEVIESVAVLPNGYRVLKIYENGALVMKNNLISEYNFSTKELIIVQEINWDSYYQSDYDSFYRLGIYLKDNKIEKINFFSGNNLNYTNFDYYHD